MLIEAAKGGHTNVVNLLLDYPNSILSPSPDLQQLANTESQLNANEVQSFNELPSVRKKSTTPFFVVNFT